ncbi:MAG: hypothetical protein ABI954_07860 [Pyrinomonadaceae bacterium]
MNKKLYLSIYLASFIAALLLGLTPIVGFLLTTGLGNARREPLLMSLLSLAVLGLLQFAVVSLVCVCILLYKMWASINDGHARTTPGKAIGFLFVPFFNIYWIFQVWGGFPADYNAYLERHQLFAPRLSSGIYSAYPILCLLSALPVVGILIAIIGTFVFLAVVSKTCDAVNLLEIAIHERPQVSNHSTIHNQMATST